MKPAELIECGYLMQAHAAGTTTAEQVLRMKELMARAKVELPHDDPSTPDVDEGDTEEVRRQKRVVACQQRAHDVLEGLKRELPEVLELVLKGVVVLAKR